MLAIHIAGAFEKVSHPGVLHKAKCYGISDPLLTWLRSYLENRQIKEFIGGQSSTPHKIKTGVRQRSFENVDDMECPGDPEWSQMHPSTPGGSTLILGGQRPSRRCLGHVKRAMGHLWRSYSPPQYNLFSGPSNPILFSRNGDIKRHNCTAERQKRIEDQRGSRQCTHCGRWFRSKDGLAVHRCCPHPNSHHSQRKPAASKTADRL